MSLLRKHQAQESIQIISQVDSTLRRLQFLILLERMLERTMEYTRLKFQQRTRE